MGALFVFKLELSFRAGHQWIKRKEERDMYKALVFALGMAASPLAAQEVSSDMSEDALKAIAATVSADDCLAIADISEAIATLRQEGRSERRATRMLTRGRNAVDERYRPVIPQLTALFYSLPSSQVMPETIGEGIRSNCPEVEEDS